MWMACNGYACGRKEKGRLAEADPEARVYRLEIEIDTPGNQ